MKESEFVRQHSREVLQFLKERYPVFHNSNVFFRDIHYGLREYLAKNGMVVEYSPAEDVARDFIKGLEEEEILVQVDHQTWTLHYPEFRKEPVKQPEAAKAAPKPAPPQAQPGETKTT